MFVSSVTSSLDKRLSEFFSPPDHTKTRPESRIFFITFRYLESFVKSLFFALMNITSWPVLFLTAPHFEILTIHCRLVGFAKK